MKGVDGEIMRLDELSQSDEIKDFLHENFKEMVEELQKRQMQLVEIYKNNPAFPFDFYNLSLREADTKISGIRELYKSITNEELE